MLDVSEAAELVGNVSPRTWQYWEAGRSKVPPDVDSEMYALIAIRNELINIFMDKFKLDDIGPVRWFHVFEDFQTVFPDENKVTWRIYQSCIALLFTEGGEIELSTEVEVLPEIVAKLNEK